MFLTFISFLEQINDFFLGYVALVGICLLGGYITIRSGFFQIRHFPNVIRTFIGCFKKEEHHKGTHPLKVFFASVGGMIGIGNVVAITTAITVGGPGSLLWVWLTALFGSLVKYSEIFLGHKYRVSNSRGGYDGGPMYFLRHAYSWKWIPTLVSILLCIYGTEIYQFSVIVQSVSENFQLDRSIVIAGLLGIVLFSAFGGVERVGKICGILMPFFTSSYLLMCFWVFVKNWDVIPNVLTMVVKSAFTGHAAIGGFAGAGVLVALQQGAARAAYSADIGIGYDSIIQSETEITDPTRQARLSILGVFIDNIVCTSSILVVLITGIWKLENPIAGSLLVQTALSQYFPGMSVFMPVFLFILGYTTIIAYLCVCIKCARLLNEKFGVYLYVIFAVPTFVLFSYYDQTYALLVMSIAQSLLLILNLSGIFRLRNQIRFK